MTTSIARRGAVQLVTLASATLSAAYYTQQAPDILVTVDGFSVNPLAAGLGLIAFALDTVKPEMARIAGDGDYGAIKRVTAGFVFSLLFVASMLAVDGFLIKLRSDWAATRGHAITDYADARKAVTDLEVEVQKVAAARTTEQVRAAMDKAHVPARTWKDTEQCTKIGDDDDRRLCRPILDLREEMAAAIRKADLEPRLTKARAKLDALQAPKSADPQADALATWWGVKVDLVAYVLVAILGFAVEAVACLGVWIVQRPKASPGTLRSRDASPKGAEGSVSPKGSAEVANPSDAHKQAGAKGSPKGSANASLPPKASADVREAIEAFVLTEVALRRSIGSQRELAERFACAESTVSEALADLEGRCLIRRRMEGRRKVTEAAA